MERHPAGRGAAAVFTDAIGRTCGDRSCAGILAPIGVLRNRIDI